MLGTLTLLSLRRYTLHTPQAKREPPFSTQNTYSLNSKLQFTVVQFNGGLNNRLSANDSGEAKLDNQYILSIAYPITVTEFSTAGRGFLIPDGDSPTAADNTSEPYLDFLLALTKMDNDDIPNSISLSYGENEQEIPPSYATQVCNLFEQLGARGNQSSSRAAIPDQEISASQTMATTALNSNPPPQQPVPG
jgi:hypothetical protein